VKPNIKHKYTTKSRSLYKEIKESAIEQQGWDNDDIHSRGPRKVKHTAKRDCIILSESALALSI